MVHYFIPSKHRNKQNHSKWIRLEYITYDKIESIYEEISTIFSDLESRLVSELMKNPQALRQLVEKVQSNRVPCLDE